MKGLNYYLDALREGYRTHSRAYAIMRRYDSPCKESSRELQEAGITKEKWDRIRFGSDISLEGILYSIGGMASWFKQGVPE